MHFTLVVRHDDVEHEMIGQHRGVEVARPHDDARRLRQRRRQHLDQRSCIGNSLPVEHLERGGERLGERDQ